MIVKCIFLFAKCFTSLRYRSQALAPQHLLHNQPPLTRSLQVGCVVRGRSITCRVPLRLFPPPLSFSFSTNLHVALCPRRTQHIDSVEGVYMFAQSICTLSAPDCFYYYPPPFLPPFFFGNIYIHLFGVRIDWTLVGPHRSVVLVRTDPLLLYR